METFSLQTRKLNIIEYLVAIQDEELFSKIESFVNKSRENIHPLTKKMTRKELIARTEKAEIDIQNKKLISQFDLEKESQLW